VRFQFARSSGPGGQNVNKVNTKAEIWVRLSSLHGLRPEARERLRKIAGKRLTTVGEIHIASDTERTQDGNRLAVLARFRALLATAVHEPKRRRKTKPTKASRRRRLESKRRRSQVKTGRRGAGSQD
jgi:ribosome-associated protein